MGNYEKQKILFSHLGISALAKFRNLVTLLVVGQNCEGKITKI